MIRAHYTKEYKSKSSASDLRNKFIAKDIDFDCLRKSIPETVRLEDALVATKINYDINYVITGSIVMLEYNLYADSLFPHVRKNLNDNRIVTSQKVLPGMSRAIDDVYGEYCKLSYTSQCFNIGINIYNAKQRL